MTQFPSAPAENRPRNGAFKKNGLRNQACRGPGKNSNIATARSGDGSGFVAAMKPTRGKIFSLEIGGLLGASVLIQSEPRLCPLF
jgi:hypothetical protein